MRVRKPRPSRQMVSVGTHVPLVTKMAFEVYCQKLGKTPYEVLQDIVMDLTKGIKVEVSGGALEEIDGADLLG